MAIYLHHVIGNSSLNGSWVGENSKKRGGGSIGNYICFGIRIVYYSKTTCRKYNKTALIVLSVVKCIYFKRKYSKLWFDWFDLK